jgi:hypothetical protein
MIYVHEKHKENEISKKIYLEAKIFSYRNCENN